METAVNRLDVNDGTHNVIGPRYVMLLNSPTNPCVLQNMNEPVRAVSQSDSQSERSGTRKEGRAVPS